MMNQPVERKDKVTNAQAILQAVDECFGAKTAVRVQRALAEDDEFIPPPASPRKFVVVTVQLFGYKDRIVEAHEYLLDEGTLTFGLDRRKVATFTPGSWVSVFPEG